jgi:hypothetical protein
MKTNIIETIEVLKLKVRQNLIQIQTNQKEIRELLGTPASDERSTKMEELYASNKLLLAENSDFISVQLTLSNFIDKYSNTSVLEGEMANVKAPLSENECFEKTINGELTFNQEHPFYSDNTFFQKLMNHYQSMEDYETCSLLLKDKKN